MKYDSRGMRYLTYAEFAKQHGVKETTVRQWAHRGVILVKLFGLAPYIWEAEPIVHAKMGRPKKCNSVTKKCNKM